MPITPPSSSDDLPASATAPPDRRLSVLEVCVFVVALGCGVIFAAVSARDNLIQTRTDQLNSAAQAVSAWISAAHKARLNGASLEPDRCRASHHQPLSFCFSDMVSSGQPFDGLQNTALRHSAAPSFAFAFIPAAGAVTDGQPCATFSATPYLSGVQGVSRQRPENWAGLIIVRNASFMDDLSVTINRLDIGYCNSDQAIIWIRRAVAF